MGLTIAPRQERVRLASSVRDMVGKKRLLGALSALKGEQSAGNPGSSDKLASAAAKFMPASGKGAVVAKAASSLTRKVVNRPSSAPPVMPDAAGGFEPWTAHDSRGTAGGFAGLIAAAQGAAEVENMRPSRGA